MAYLALPFWLVARRVAVIMDISCPLPRVGASHLRDFVGRRVLFVGRVDKQEGGTIDMEAPDGGKVTVHARGPFSQPIAEVEGIVLDPQTIREEARSVLNDNFGTLWP